MRTNVWILLVVFTLSFACAREPQDPLSNRSNGDGQQDTTTQSPTAYQESTARQDARQILTGVITDKGQGLYLFPKRPGGWILVEEDPGAGCGGDRGPLKPGCEKMYFDVTGKTRTPAEGDLEKGWKVSVDYSGYDVAMSYPSQTDARAITVLGTPRRDREPSN